MYDINQCDTAVLLKGRKTRRVFLSTISVSQVANIDTMRKPTRGAHHHMVCCTGLARMCTHLLSYKLVRCHFNEEEKLIQASVLLHHGGGEKERVTGQLFSAFVEKTLTGREGAKKATLASLHTVNPVWPVPSRVKTDAKLGVSMTFSLPLRWAGTLV